MYFLIWIRKNADLPWQLTAINLKKIVTSVKWTTALMKITQPPKLLSHTELHSSDRPRWAFLPQTADAVLCWPWKTLPQTGRLFHCSQLTPENIYFFSSVNLVLAREEDILCYLLRIPTQWENILWFFLVGAPITSPASNNHLHTTKSHEDHPAKISRYFVIWSKTSSPSRK